MYVRMPLILNPKSSRDLDLGPMFQFHSLHVGDFLGSVEAQVFYSFYWQLGLFLWAVLYLIITFFFLNRVVTFLFLLLKSKDVWSVSSSKWCVVRNHAGREKGQQKACSWCLKATKFCSSRIRVCQFSVIWGSSVSSSFFFLKILFWLKLIFFLMYRCYEGESLVRLLKLIQR